MNQYQLPVNSKLSLPCYEWPSQQSNTKALIVFLHGFNNHGSNYFYLGEWFSSQGYIFVAYDHRDHGASPLRNKQCSIADMVNDARTIIRQLHQKYPDLPVFLMGSSMGGALSILAAQDEPGNDIPDLLQGLILWAPQVVATSRRPRLYKILKAISAIAPDIKIPIGVVAGHNLPRQCNDKQLTDLLVKDKKMLKDPNVGLITRVLTLGDQTAKANFKKDFRILMLFGGSDTLIFHYDIKQFVARIKSTNAEIDYCFYPNNRHMLWADLNREEIYQDTLRWMEQANFKNE